MNGVSLFSGAGGFELGFERAGIRTVLQAESDPWCLSVLERHWPNVERVTDVRQVDAAALQGRRRDMFSVGTDSDAEWLGATRGRRNSPTSVDLVYGGFPCQDVSVAGKRAGLGGARSGLWTEFHRVLFELRPQWLCAENVPGLLSSAGGRDFGQILSDLDELWYGVAWAVLDARYFGVAQRRRRVFIVGCLGNPNAAAQVLAVCESCGGHPASGSETGQRLAASLTSDSHGASSNMPGRHHEDDVNLVVHQPEARALTARASGYRMDGETETFVVSPPVKASDGYYGNNTEAESLVVADHHGHSSPRGDGAGLQRSDVLGSASGVRRLTPLEAERLMGWPDEHTRYTADGREIPDSHRYRLCGNGVVGPVAEWIGHRLVAVDRMLTEQAA